MDSRNEIDPQTTKIVERNVNALLERRDADKTNRTVQHKIVSAITCFAGSMLSVYLHLIVFGFWIIWNLGWFGFKPFDTSFIILSSFAAVEAIFLSTFILISQNQLRKEEDKRAELALQVSLLTEHEVTRIISMLSAIAKKMGLEEIVDEEIKGLSKDVYPEKVMDTLETAAAGKK